jgi:hypothetical protein
LSTNWKKSVFPMRTFFYLIRLFPPFWIVVLFFGGFTKFDQTALENFSLFSEVIDLSKKDQVKWEPIVDRWKSFGWLTPYKGEAMLSLVFDNHLEALADKTNLQVEMSAIGVNENGIRQNRWIINGDGTSNKPFSKPRRMWESRKLWGLGLINITGDEKIIINISITEPNLCPKLERPRFKLQVSHDYAWVGYGQRIQFVFFDILFTALAVGISIIGLSKKASNQPLEDIY